MRRHRRIARSPWLGLSAIGLLAQAGCGTRANFRLIQPNLPSPQDEVRLRSDWAYVSDDQPGLERIVLMFPLPGARAGDRQFFIYLRVPGKRSKPFHIGDPLPGGGRVGGFLIQATGRLAGKTVFTKGKIELHGVPFSGGLRRRGKTTLYCADGSMVEGEFVAIMAPLEVSDFEDAKAGDVRALIQANHPPPDETQSGLDATKSGGRP